MSNPNHACIAVREIKRTGLEKTYALPQATTYYSPAPGRGRE